MKSFKQSIRIVVAAVVMFLVFGGALQAAYVEESFTGNSVSGWTFVTAAGDGPVLTAAEGIDFEDDGWLRLTADKGNQNSLVYYNNPIQTNLGLVFTFDFVIWSATSSNADGFALVVFDAEASPVDPGGWGGSLGYAQHTSSLGVGMNGGIAAFGFDTFGNFSNPTEGRIGGPGRSPNSIAIRGSMGADRTLGYEYVTGVEDLPDFATGSAVSRDDAVVHTVRLTITPEKLVTIEWKEEGGDWETLLNCFSCTLDCPSQIKFGFAASTGGVYSNQEIRNVDLSPYLELDAPPAIGIGPVVAMSAFEWPILSTEPDSPIVLNQDYSVLWTFSDDYAFCPEFCTHTAQYKAVGDSTWTELTVTTDESGEWYAYVALPVEDLENATTYALRFTITDCAEQSTDSGLYYFRVVTEDNPPVIEAGPILTAGYWPVLPRSAARALVLDQNYDVLWAFSDDYASCPNGACTHRARYKHVDSPDWTWFTVSTDSKWMGYPYATLPIASSSLAAGTYMFQFDVADCVSQRTFPWHYYYFKVEE